MKVNGVYKITSSILFVITVMMVVPAQVESTSNSLEFGGSVELIKYDENGNNIFTQTIHNRLVDTGEEFLLDQVFQDSTTTADDMQIGSICLSDAGTFVVAETETASDFDGDNTITETNCQEDTTVTTSSGTAVIGPLTFSAGGTHAADDDTITGIGICQNDTTDDTAFNNCASEGILFAVVNTSDVTLAAGETVQITYTFDISSSGT